MTTEENLCNLTFNHGKKVKKAHKSVLTLCCTRVTKDSPNECKISKEEFESLPYIFNFAYNNTKPTVVTPGLTEIVELLGCKALQNYIPPSWNKTKRRSVKYVKQPQVKKVNSFVLFRKQTARDDNRRKFM